MEVQCAFFDLVFTSDRRKGTPALWWSKVDFFMTGAGDRNGMEWLYVDVQISLAAGA